MICILFPKEPTKLKAGRVLVLRDQVLVIRYTSLCLCTTPNLANIIPNCIKGKIVNQTGVASWLFFILSDDSVDFLTNFFYIHV